MDFIAEFEVAPEVKLPNYEKPLKYIASFIALAIPATFASIPIYLYIRNL